QQRARLLLRLYQQILQQGEVTVDGSFLQKELLLSGLVIKQVRLGETTTPVLTVNNLIYQTVFDQAWVERNCQN
ncbi:MAG TPA: hypothetical protein V6D33_13555, partial [Cyanophyceae cyanobacterium]